MTEPSCIETNVIRCPDVNFSRQHLTDKSRIRERSGSPSIRVNSKETMVGILSTRQVLELKSWQSHWKFVSKRPGTWSITASTCSYQFNRASKPPCMPLSSSAYRMCRERDRMGRTKGKGKSGTDQKQTRRGRSGPGGVVKVSSTAMKRMIWVCHPV